MGIRVLKFMDDFPSGGLSEIQQTLHAKFMCEHLHSLGWLIKAKKFIGIPPTLTTIPALGTRISFSDQKFYLGQEQVAQIVDLAGQLAKMRTIPVQKLARLAGLIVSRQHCLGPAARMRTRAMYKDIDERLKPYEKGQSKAGWKRHVHLNTRTRAELVFWVSRLGKVNGQPFHRQAVHRTMDVNLGTDTSQPGWGTVITLPPNTPADQSALLRAAQLTLPKNMSVQAIVSAVSSGIRICGMFSEAEASESSNARELLATLYSGNFYDVIRMDFFVLCEDSQEVGGSSANPLSKI